MEVEQAIKVDHQRSSPNHLKVVLRRRLEAIRVDFLLNSLGFGLVTLHPLVIGVGLENIRGRVDHGRKERPDVAFRLL